MILEHKIIGQSIVKYQVPFDIFTAINSFYNKNKDTLESSNEFLIGKIKNEKTLFYSKAIINQLTVSFSLSVVQVVKFLKPIIYQI